MKICFQFRWFPSLAVLALWASACSSPTPANDAGAQVDTGVHDANTLADTGPVDAGPVDTGRVDSGRADVAMATDAAVSTMCPEGTTRCGEACLDTMTDPLHCGACTAMCPDVNGGTATCTAGACGVRCAEGRTLCDAGGEAVCVNTTTHGSHCGACGNVCAEGSACVAGACVKGCPAPRTLCGTAPMQVCTDTSADPTRCGNCETSCPEPADGVATCTAGVCGVRCNEGNLLCGTGPSAACARVATDVANCGACGNVCPSVARATPTCTEGRCGVVCNTGFTACTVAGASQCVDTQADSANCGACGNVCPAGNACTAGACVSTCVAPRMECGSSCLDVRSDAANCGGCGIACQGYETCQAGQCQRTHYRVFVTSTTRAPGAHGGIAGADRFCQSHADAANLGGRWMAWVSTPTSSPSMRFTRSTLPYRTLNGRQIAMNYQLLTSLRGLDAPINITELGLPVSYTVNGTSCAVFTSSYGNGTFIRLEVTRDVYNNACDDLTNASPVSVRAPHLTSLVGQYSATYTVGNIPEWSYRCTFPGCNTPLGLYCFEQ